MTWSNAPNGVQTNGFKWMELAFQDENETVTTSFTLVHNHDQETQLLLMEWHKLEKKSSIYSAFFAVGSY